MKTITMSAIMLDGVTHEAPPPARHHNIIQAMFAAGLKPSRGVQGFIDSDGQFQDREQAAQIALAAGQVKVGHANIRHEFDGRRLFSENSLRVVG